MSALRRFVASAGAGAVALGLALAGAGCDSMFVQPDTGTGGLKVSFSIALDAGGDAQAFDRADAARIVLQRRSGGAVVVDRVVALAASAVGREASVEVEVTEDPEVFDLTVQLLAGTQPLFAGTAAVTVRRGQATAVELPLQPVVASVVFPSSPVVLTAINQTLTLRAWALYVSGDTARSVAVQWASQNQAIVTVSAAGVLTARAEGQTQVIATAGAASAALQVRVQAAVGSVTVLPARDTLSVGEEVQLLAVARDLNGNSLVRTPAWQSSNPGVASVDATGRVRAISAGAATITATVEGRVGTSAIVVLLPPVRTVTVLPATTTVQVGGSLQLLAELRTADGVLVTRPVQWSSSNAAVASVSGSGLVLGVAPGSATITALAEGVSGTAQVTVVSPVLSVSPASLGFTGVQGGANPSPQSLSVSNAGTGTLGWSVSENAGWLSVSPTSGTNSGTVTVSVSTAALAAGVYNASITVAGNASNSPVNVPVTLTVTAVATTGQIGGRVTTVTGAPIAGATVTVVGTTRSAVTGADGSFLVTSLVPGFYAVSASAPGFLSTTTSEQYVAAGQTTTFNLTLASLPSPPAAPSALVARPAGTTAIDLSWTDNSNNESGFRIERCLATEVEGCITAFAEIATVGANTTSYRNSGLPTVTTYGYRVRAYNLGGNSAYSNTATATTVAPVAPVLSGGSYSVWTIKDSGCSLYGPTRLGTSFRVVFSFTDANGDVPLSSSAVGGSWVFYPSGASGGVGGTYRYQPSVTGSGSSGTVTTYQCYVFGSDSYVDVTMTLTDSSGRTGTLAPIRITKPAGAN